MTTFNSIWDAIENTPGQSENMKIRAYLMRSIEGRMIDERWSQKEAAKRFGVDQPRVSDLIHGKIDKFSIDSLVKMAVAAGFQVQVDVVKLEPV